MAKAIELDPALRRWEARTLAARRALFVQTTANLYREHVDPEDDIEHQVDALATAHVDQLDAFEPERPTRDELLAAVRLIMTKAPRDELREVLSGFLLDVLPLAQLRGLVLEHIEHVPVEHQIDILDVWDPSERVAERLWWMKPMSFSTHRADVDAFVSKYIKARVNKAVR